MIYYRKPMELEAHHLLQTLEHYRPFVEELTGNKRKNIPILIEDMGNSANGFANPIGNTIAVFSHFPTDGELAFMEDWWTEVGVHEYIHIMQMTRESGLPKALRILFGNVMHSNIFMPMWMIEGITVYGESQLSEHSGRLNGGVYPAINRSLAKFNKLPSPAKAAYYSLDTPHAHYYIFGGSFFDYLSETYGEQEFSRFYEINGGLFGAYFSPFFPAWGIDRSAKKVYGKSLPMLWKDWIEDEKWLARDYRLPQQYLSKDGWNKRWLQKSGENLIYEDSRVIKTSLDNSFYGSRLIRFDPKTGRKEVLLRQSEEFPAGYQLQGDLLFYSRREQKYGYGNNNMMGYGTYTQLMMKDLNSKGSRTLFQGDLRAFEVRHDGRIVIARDLEHGRGSELLLLNTSKEGAVPTCLLKTDYLIHGIFHYGERLFVNARKYWQNSSIYEVDLEGQTLTPFLDTPRREAITSIDDKYIYFTANYDDFLASYAYDLNQNETFRIDGSDFMSDAVLDETDNVAYYLSLSDKGYELSSNRKQLFPYKHRQFTASSPPQPSVWQSSFKTDTKSADDYIPGQNIRKGNYFDNLKHLIVPRMGRSPIILAEEDSIAVGASLYGNDVVGHFPYWELSLLYDFYHKDFKLDVSLENTLLKPLHHSLYYTSLNEHVLISDQYLYLFNRLNYGLSSIKSGISFETRESYTRKIWNPYLDFTFNFPELKSFHRLMGKVESTDFTSSDRKRNGVQTIHDFVVQVFNSADLRSRIHLAYDPDADKDEVFSSLRGYSDGMQARSGLKLQNTLSTILFKVRKGTWNPQFYLEDVGGGLFFDFAAPKKGEGESQMYSAGLELKAETSFAFLASVNIGFRIAINRDKKISPGLFLNSGI